MSRKPDPNSLRQRLFRLWVSNERLPAQHLSSQKYARLLGVSYKEKGNYIRKELSEFRSYQWPERWLNNLHAAHKRSAEENLEMLLWSKVIFEHQGPFTEDEISLAFVTKIMDILADAGLMKKTLKHGEPFYKKTGRFRSVEQADAAIKSCLKQGAKRLGVEL